MSNGDTYSYEEHGASSRFPGESSASHRRRLAEGRRRQSQVSSRQRDIAYLKSRGKYKQAQRSQERLDARFIYPKSEEQATASKVARQDIVPTPNTSSSFYMGPDYTGTGGTLKSFDTPEETIDYFRSKDVRSTWGRVKHKYISGRGAQRRQEHELEKFGFAGGPIGYGVLKTGEKAFEKPIYKLETDVATQKGEAVSRAIIRTRERVGPDTPSQQTQDIYKEELKTTKAETGASGFGYGVKSFVADPTSRAMVVGIGTGAVRYGVARGYQALKPRITYQRTYLKDIQVTGEPYVVETPKTQTGQADLVSSGRTVSQIKGPIGRVQERVYTRFPQARERYGQPVNVAGRVEYTYSKPTATGQYGGEVIVETPTTKPTKGQVAGQYKVEKLTLEGGKPFYTGRSSSIGGTKFQEGKSLSLQSSEATPRTIIKSQQPGGGVRIYQTTGKGVSFDVTQPKTPSKFTSEGFAISRYKPYKIEQPTVGEGSGAQTFKGSGRKSQLPIYEIKSTLESGIKVEPPKIKPSPKVSSVRPAPTTTQKSDFQTSTSSFTIETKSRTRGPQLKQGIITSQNLSPQVSQMAIGGKSRLGQRDMTISKQAQIQLPREATQTDERIFLIPSYGGGGASYTYTTPKLPPFFFPPLPPMLPSGGGGSRKQRGKRRKQPRAYTPSGYSLVTGLTGKPTRGGIVSGLGPRPLKTKWAKAINI